MRSRERLSREPAPRLRGTHGSAGAPSGRTSRRPPVASQKAGQGEQRVLDDALEGFGEAPAARAGAATLRGRGTPENPANRFETLAYEIDDEALAAARTDDAAETGASGTAEPAPRTLYLRDPSRTIIARNQSPDVPFSASINPYRGCEHGCIYCYARPTHEYLGFSAGLDFETRILVKEEAPALLRRELSAKRWQPQLLGLSGVTTIPTSRSSGGSS